MVCKQSGSKQKTLRTRLKTKPLGTVKLTAYAICNQNNQT